MYHHLTSRTGMRKNGNAECQKTQGDAHFCPVPRTPDLKTGRDETTCKGKRRENFRKKKKKKKDEQVKQKGRVRNRRDCINQKHNQTQHTTDIT